MPARGEDVLKTKQETDNEEEKDADYKDLITRIILENIDTHSFLFLFGIHTM